MIIALPTTAYIVYHKDGTKEKRNVVSVKEQINNQLKYLRRKVIRANPETAKFINQR